MRIGVTILMENNDNLPMVRRDFKGLNYSTAAEAPKKLGGCEAEKQLIRADHMLLEGDIKGSRETNTC